MSVMMGMRLTVDPERFERVAHEKREQLTAIAERAKEMGAIHHVFLANGGEVIIADEWDREESFQRFFESESKEIGELMAAAGVTNEPQPTFVRPLDTGDRF